MRQRHTPAQGNNRLRTRVRAWTTGPAPRLILVFVAISFASQVLLAQVPAQRGPAAVAVAEALPDAPDASAGAADTSAAPPQILASPLPGNKLGNATMSGTVMEVSGAVLTGASVTLKNTLTNETRTTVSDENGYFSFAAIVPGTYSVVITATGFASWTETNIPMGRDADLDLPGIALKIASATTEVRVVFSEHELATEQLHIEEKQRVLGVFPNFYASYVWNAAPLSPRQKFQLAWRSSIDPMSFVGSGITAGIEQWQNDYPGYGQGAQGYAKRFGAAYADGFVGNFIGGAIFPIVLHQDPRYFYKGTGSIRSRALYAIATTVICKGDNGRWQPNYSNVLGDLAAGGISNLYVPAQDRNGWGVTFDNALIGVAAGAAGSLVQEFLLHRITPSARAHSNP